MFTRTLLLAAVLALSACTDEVVVAGYLTQAEVHVEPAKPDALVQPMIRLDVLGGDEPHYISLDTATLSADNGVNVRLAMSLDEPAILVPANTELVLDVVNRGVHNSDLAPFCQHTYPLSLWVTLPGDSQLVIPAGPLAIFCP